MIKKDVPIYYRKLYTGVAVVELMDGLKENRIDFAIESKPTGQKEISVSFLEKLDYPIVPLVKELKQLIARMDDGGELPD
ncbi:MAG: hypothetical protein FWG99_11570 [Treponema sp.]|nr:hypothetical protein [Treponema sp.]